MRMGFAWKVAWLTWAFVVARVITALAADALPDGPQAGLGTPRIGNRELVAVVASAPSDARAAHPDSASPAERRALDRLLEGSGLKVQLESLSAGIRAQFLRSAPREQDR